MRVCLTINLRCMLRLLASPLFIDLIGKRVCVAGVCYFCVFGTSRGNFGSMCPKNIGENYWAGMSMYIEHNLQYSK